MIYYRFPLSRSLLDLRQSSSSPGSNTPPPHYTSCEDVRTRGVGGASQAPSPERVREAVEAIPEEGGTMEHDQEGGGGGGGGVGYDGATATQSAPLLGPVDGGSRHGSLDSAANSRNREIQIKDEVSIILLYPDITSTYQHHIHHSTCSTTCNTCSTTTTYKTAVPPHLL